MASGVSGQKPSLTITSGSLQRSLWTFLRCPGCCGGCGFAKNGAWYQKPKNKPCGSTLFLRRYLNPLIVPQIRPRKILRSIGKGIYVHPSVSHTIGWRTWLELNAPGQPAVDNFGVYLCDINVAYRPQDSPSYHFFFRDGRLYSQDTPKPKINMDTPQRYTVWYLDMHIYITLKSSLFKGGFLPYRNPEHRLDPSLHQQMLEITLDMMLGKMWVL